MLRSQWNPSGPAADATIQVLLCACLLYRVQGLPISGLPALTRQTRVHCIMLIAVYKLLHS